MDGSLSIKADHILREREREKEGQVWVGSGDHHDHIEEES
jgi:hypothetical protein